MWGRRAGGGGRGCLGFLALDLTALLALWAVVGLATPADFHRGHKKITLEFKGTENILGQSCLCLCLDSALRSSSCSCCPCPIAARRPRATVGDPNCKARILLKQLL